MFVFFFFSKKKGNGGWVWKQKWYVHVCIRLTNRGSLGWHIVHNKEDFEILVCLRQQVLKTSRMTSTIKSENTSPIIHLLSLDFEEACPESKDTSRVGRYGNFLCLLRQHCRRP
jgi:hypothetical protein